MCKDDEMPDTLGAADILGLMITGRFRPLSESEKHGWAGIEYEGWICTHNGYEIVLDVGPSGIHGNIAATPSLDRQKLWTFQIDADNFRRVS